MDYEYTGVITKKTHVQALFDHNNSQQHSITFTIEEEDEEGTLPMLDVRIVKHDISTSKHRCTGK